MTLARPPATPEAVVVFERLFLVSIVVGIVQAVDGWNDLLDRAPATTIMTMLVLTLGTQVALVLLASRGRSNAAKWVLLAMLLIGLPLYLSSLKDGTIIGRGLLSLIQALLQTISVALLFTPSAREWFKQQSSA